MIQRHLPTSVVAEADRQEQEADEHISAVHTSSAPLSMRSLQEQAQGAASAARPEPNAEEASGSTMVSASPAAQPSGEQPNAEPGRGLHPPDVVCSQVGAQGSLLAQCSAITIEQAIRSYLQEQRASGRSHKTMEWHQMALGLFEQYLVGERQFSLLCQVTESEVQGWFAFLRTTPSSVDTGRSVGTIATYARSARAFCHWLVRNGHLEQIPFVKGTIPKAAKRRIRLIEADEFERLLLVCQPEGDSGIVVERAVARNRALLWVLLDTGIRVSELCGLRLSDVDREQRALRVQRTGGKERWLRLSANGWCQLLSYLEQHRPLGGCVERGRIEEDHLFLSEWYQPLTVNGITLLFARLKKRAGISEKRVSPSVLRDTFAVHYLQEGGEPEALRDMLGLADVAAVKCYQCLSEQIEKEQPKEPAEEQLFRQTTGPQKSRRWRRSSSAIAKKRTQRGVGSSKLGEISTDFEVKLTKSARRVEIDHPEPG